MKETDPRAAPAAPRAPADLNPRTDPVLDFPDRSLGQLTADDYSVLGFMGGLEVHQQLDCSSKLFCRCPAGRRVDRCDGEVLRHMRPTLSELGEYDGTALMEFKTRKEIVYRLERGSVCTYEIDDTPPFEIDQQAVDIAIEIALLCKLNLVSELHVMRKQYLDGSIPAGFQRTAMIGLGGTIPFRVPELGIDRPLSIRQLSLEEDSCREVSDFGHRIIFNTDRLGMPLTELVTEPELSTPDEVQAAARLLASVARCTGKVRRGPGAARQDVNVSVAGGRRVELKGVDRHKNLPLLVHNEAFRQLNLLRIRAELQRRGIEGSTLSLPATGLPWEISPLIVASPPALRRCGYAPISDADAVCALRLPRFAGILSRPTQPGVTFAREFADRVRVIACVESRPYMLHSDLADYGLASFEWSALRKQIGAGARDAIVVVWGKEEDVATAAREVFLRAAEGLDGVPAETRQVFRDGTNGFERVLPGPDRMYPDTDTPPLPIRDEQVLALKSRIPERPWERERRYEELGLGAGAAARLAVAPWAGLFDELGPAPGVVARRLAAALEKRLPYHRRRSGLEGLPPAGRLVPLVRALNDGNFRIEALEAALDALVCSDGTDAGAILKRYTPRSGDEAAIEARVSEVRRQAGAVAGKPLEVALRWSMGRVMPEFLGRVDPRTLRGRLAESLDATGPRSEA